MEKTLDQNFKDWEADVFGFGYGTGEEYTLKALKDFFRFSEKDGSYDYTVLEKELGGTVTWLMINILGHADVIEYGTSPRYGWLTTFGKRVKDFVESKSEDELYELCTNHDSNYTHCMPDACNCGPNGYEEGRKCKNPFWREF